VTDLFLTPEWLQELGRYQTLWVGFSGGLDSTVLLHLLVQNPELTSKVRAIHIHHGLSVNADHWQAHCQQFCKVLNVPLSTHAVELKDKGNVEENARIARYQVFSSVVAENDCLLVAHHADDQAETLLLQLFRGAGVDGLGAMLSSQKFAKGFLARPLLQQTRQILETYANLQQLNWIEDESNTNTSFLRNYLRHELMPLIKKRWPKAVGNLVRSAAHCQQAKSNLEALATIDYEALAESEGKLLISPSFLTLDYGRQVNVLRAWLKYNNIRLPSTQILNRLINEVILAQADAKPSVEWGNVIVRRYQKTLYLLRENTNPPSLSKEWIDFPSDLILNREGNEYLQALPAENGLLVPPRCHLQVRFREGGELFSWRGQTKQLKKLWQEWGVPPWCRDSIPLLYINNELAVVIGFAINDRFYHKGANAYHIKWHRQMDHDL